MKSLEVTGKTRVLFISFGSKPVLPRSLWSRTTFLPGEMECLQAWKKIKKMKKKVLFPLSALHAFHYPRLCRLDARNVTYEGKLVKLKQNQSRPFLFQYGKKKSFQGSVIKQEPRTMATGTYMCKGSGGFPLISFIL